MVCYMLPSKPPKRITISWGHWRPQTSSTIQNWLFTFKLRRPNLPRCGTTRLRRCATMNAPTQRCSQRVLDVDKLAWPALAQQSVVTIAFTSVPDYPNLPEPPSRARQPPALKFFRSFELVSRESSPVSRRRKHLLFRNCELCERWVANHLSRGSAGRDAAQPPALRQARTAYRGH